MRSKKTVWRLVRWTRPPSKFLSYIHAITCLYLCTYVLICVYNLCFYIYIYTYIYTHIYMYMCVYIYTCMYWQFYSPGSYVFINLFIHTNLWTGLPNNHQWSQRKFRYICTAYCCCLQWHFFNLKSQSMI